MRVVFIKPPFFRLVGSHNNKVPVELSYWRAAVDAHGSPVGGSTSRGLAGQVTGCDEGEQPVFGKEAVRPAEVILPPATAFTIVPSPTTPCPPTVALTRYPSARQASAH